MSDNLEEGDRKFAGELQPSIVNFYGQCHLLVDQIELTESDSISEKDYDNIINYCKVKTQNLHDAYCKPMDEEKYADKGEKACVTILKILKEKLTVTSA